MKPVSFISILRNMDIDVEKRKDFGVPLSESLNFDYLSC